MIDTKALSAFKEKQKQSWALFSPLESVTTIPAAELVNYAKVTAGSTLLDVGCGTGVVAITAARKGANVCGIDLSPVLIHRACENAAIAKVDIHFEEGDAESLSFPDNHFDFVLSQFGHMFAPRPQITIQEMLRVLKPGGVIAFSTWPPNLFVGRMFSLVAKYAPAPEWASPPALWGDSNFVQQQFGNKVDNVFFHQGLMAFVALSLGHYQQCIETTLGPIIKFLDDHKDNPKRISQFRAEFEALAKEYYSNNAMQQHYLLTRANKREM